MSTSPVSSSTASSTTTGYQLTSQGTGTALQITGLASGLDTNEIITELMSIQKQPETALQNQVTGLTTENTNLTSIQSALQTLASDAQALGDPSLFATSQAVSSSNSALVSGTSATGAGIGGYQVSVSQLANSAQRTFTYATPTTAGTLQVDGQQVNVSANESISDFVNAINSNSKLDVYAAATDSGTVVLSNRTTGGAGSSDNNGSDFIQVTNATGGAAGLLTEQAGTARAGQDAQLTVDGGSTITSTSNTVTNAIAGVSLSLGGVTTTSGPVTIDVSPPAASSSNVQTAVNSFVTQYNSVISQIQTALTQAPSSSDPTQGTLYDDTELSGLLSSMRDSMITNGGGLPSGMASMNDIGINTGATTGSGAVSQSSLNGDLTLNASTLTAALSSNPSGVQAMLNTWSINFSAMVNETAAPGGTIDERIQGDNSNMSQLNDQISNMQAALTQQQNQLTEQFAQMESALSQNQSESSALTSEIAQL